MSPSIKTDKRLKNKKINDENNMEVSKLAEHGVILMS